MKLRLMGYQPPPTPLPHRNKYSSNRHTSTLYTHISPLRNFLMYTSPSSSWLEQYSICIYPPHCICIHTYTTI